MGNQPSKTTWIQKDQLKEIIIQFEAKSYHFQDIIYFMKNYCPKQKIAKTCILDIDHTLGEYWSIISKNKLRNKFGYTLECNLDDSTMNKFSFLLFFGPIPFSGQAKGRFFARPFLFFFLNFIEKCFDEIIIWTAGSKSYAREIVTNLHKNYRYYSNENLLNGQKIVSQIGLDPKETWLIDDNKIHVQNVLHPPFYVEIAPFEVYPSQINKSTMEYNINHLGNPMFLFDPEFLHIALYIMNH